MPRQTRGSAAVCSSDGDIIRRVAFTEAHKMESTGEVVKICKHCGGMDAKSKRCTGHGQVHNFVFMVTSLYRNTHASSTTLGFAEMLANVGQSRKDERDHGISEAFAFAVRSKVTNWTAIHDDRAPLTSNTQRATSVPDVQYQAVDRGVLDELISPLPCTAENLEAGFASMGICPAG